MAVLEQPAQRTVVIVAIPYGVHARIIDYDSGLSDLDKAVAVAIVTINPDTPADFVPVLVNTIQLTHRERPGVHLSGERTVDLYLVPVIVNVSLNHVFAYHNLNALSD